MVFIVISSSSYEIFERCGWRIIFGPFYSKSDIMNWNKFPSFVTVWKFVYTNLSWGGKVSLKLFDMPSRNQVQMSRSPDRNGPLIIWKFRCESGGNLGGCSWIWCIVLGFIKLALVTFLIYSMKMSALRMVFIIQSYDTSRMDQKCNVGQVHLLNIFFITSLWKSCRNMYRKWSFSVIIVLYYRSVNYHFLTVFSISERCNGKYRVKSHFRFFFN